MNFRKKLRLFAWNLNGEQRLFLFAALGVVIFILLRTELNWQLSFLISWLISGGIYLLLFSVIIINANGQETKLRASRSDPNQFLLVVLIAIVTILSNLGMGILLTSISTEKLNHSGLLVGLSISDVILSWIMLNTGFALHYCKLYYDEKDEQDRPFEGGMRAGFIFPECTHPSYLDFCYLALTIALTYAVSDVNVTRTDMRVVILVHSFLSFIFYSTVFTIVLNTIVTFWSATR